MADIFLSYKKTDKQRVEPLVAALENPAFSVRWDYNIDSGENWFERIILERRILVNLARAQIGAGRLNAAGRSIADGLALPGDDDAQSLRRQFLAMEGRIAMTRGDMPRARRLMTEAFAGLDLTKTEPGFRDAHQAAYETYSKVGDSGQALKHLEAVRRLKDEASDTAAATGAALTAAKFDYAQQENQILQLKNAEALRSASRQRALFLDIGVAALAMMAILANALLLFRRSRNKVREAWAQAVLQADAPTRPG